MFLYVLSTKLTGSRTWNQYSDIFDKLSELGSVKVVVLTGAGKHFCSGIDLSCLHSNNFSSSTIEKFQHCINAPVRNNIVTIAIVHGVCYGLALDIISATNIRIGVGGSTKLSIKEIDVGIIADIGSLQRLPLITNNMSKLSELALTGEDFDCHTAKSIGLISGVFESKEDAFKYALKVGNKICKKYFPAVSGTKKHLELMTTNSTSVVENLKKVATDNSTLMRDQNFLKYIKSKF